MRRHSTTFVYKIWESSRISVIECKKRNTRESSATRWRIVADMLQFETEDTRKDPRIIIGPILPLDSGLSKTLHTSDH